MTRKRHHHILGAEAPAGSIRFVPGQGSILDLLNWLNDHAPNGAVVNVAMGRAGTLSGQWAHKPETDQRAETITVFDMDGQRETAIAMDTSIWASTGGVAPRVELLWVKAA